MTGMEYLVSRALRQWIYVPRDILRSEERQWHHTHLSFSQGNTHV